MNENNSQNAVNALLEEYVRTIGQLKDVIRQIPNSYLIKTVDFTTENSDCKSIQTLLSHIINSGYAYCVYIQKLKNENAERPKKLFHLAIADYETDLDTLVQYTYKTFEKISDFELEEFDDDKKIITSWGQIYDIEQMMEHAIVHVLRHRRQIENFLILLDK